MSTTAPRTEGTPLDDLQDFLVELQRQEQVPDHVLFKAKLYTHKLREALREESDRISNDSDAIDHFLQSVANKATRRSYAYYLKHLEQWCEGKGILLHQVTHDALSLFLQELRSRISENTVKVPIRVFKLFYDFLMKAGLVDGNPVALTRSKGHEVPGSKMLVPLTLIEVQNFFETFDVSKPVELRNRAITGLILYTFSSVEFILNMTRADYQSEISPKTVILKDGDREKKIPLHETAASYLDAYLESTDRVPNSSSRLFTASRGKVTSKKMSNTVVSDFFKSASRKAGLHDLVTTARVRLTGTIALLQAGVPEKTMQGLLGHLEPNTVARYKQLANEFSDDLSELFEEPNADEPLLSFIEKYKLFDS